MVMTKRQMRRIIGGAVGLGLALGCWGILGLAGPPAAAGAAAPASTSGRVEHAPAAIDAYAHLVPGAITVTVGASFTLDLYINSGTNTVVGQQSYLTFTNTLLQVVNPAQSGCVPATAVSADTATFEV